MANRNRGHTSIEMGGREYTLIFDWDALAQLREHYGSSYESAMTKACLENNTTELARILEIGLRAQNSELTKESIKEMSPPVLVVGGAIVDALNVAYYGPTGAPSEVGEENPLRNYLTSLLTRRTSSDKRSDSPSEPDSHPTNSGG